jgi:hypothetical protein
MDVHDSDIEKAAHPVRVSWRLQYYGGLVVSQASAGTDDDESYRRISANSHLQWLGQIFS